MRVATLGVLDYGITYIDLDTRKEYYLDSSESPTDLWVEAEGIVEALEAKERGLIYLDVAVEKLTDLTVHTTGTWEIKTGADFMEQNLREEYNEQQ